jgi:hypothetical protein
MVLRLGLKLKRPDPGDEYEVMAERGEKSGEEDIVDPDSMG